MSEVSFPVWPEIHRKADAEMARLGLAGDLARARKIAELYLLTTRDSVIREGMAAADEPLIRETVADMRDHGVGLNPHIHYPSRIAEETNFFKGQPRPHRHVEGLGVDGARLAGYRLNPDEAWSYPAEWYEAERAAARDRLEALRARRNSDVCVVVGNGPSLKRTPLEALTAPEVIISNFAYYEDALRLRATYLTMVNAYVMRQAAYDLPGLRSLNLVLPFWAAAYTIPEARPLLLNAVLRGEFSIDIADWISWRATVSFFNLQLAAGLGYRKILLVGFDHSYQQADGDREGDLITQTGDDANHFRADYFKGKVWQAADVAQMETMYGLAREALAAQGVEVVNCTEGGQLEVFRRGKLEAEL